MITACTVLNTDELDGGCNAGMEGHQGREYTTTFYTGSCHFCFYSLSNVEGVDAWKVHN